MIEISTKIIKLKKKNHILIKNVELDLDLRCFILIDSEDEKFSEIILNKLLDNIIGKISVGNAYKDFSIALENTNSTIKNWLKEEKIKGKLKIIAAVLEGNNLIFSTVGNPSCFLVKKDKQVVEITEKSENKKEFSFISNGEINSEETVIMYTGKLLHDVSRSDIIESIEAESIEDVVNNIEITLLEEKIGKNKGYVLVRNSYFKDAKKESFVNFKNNCYKLMDNNATKKCLALYMVGKDKVMQQKKGVKTILLLAGILLSFFVLYTAISSIYDKTSKKEIVNDYKSDLKKAKDLVKLAGENINNDDIFNENIKKAEKILVSIKEKNLFLTDIDDIRGEINVIKKQYNLVETFEERSDNMAYKDLPAGTKKILNLNNFLYVITKNSVIGPIVGTRKPKEYLYRDIGNDSFVDIIEIAGNIVLTTKNGKLVSFDKNGFFKNYGIRGQEKWEEFRNVGTYASYLYVLSKDGKQIYKHRKFGQNFEKGSPYLGEDKELNNIIDIAVDGGIYLLRNDLSILKVVKAPSYKLRKLDLKKLPKIYKIEKNTTIPKIVAGPKLKYVYLFLNNKIWVFRTDSPGFSQTKSLIYVGQIAGLNKIIDFSVFRDGEVQVLNKNGIFRINFEVSDDKLILR